MRLTAERLREVLNYDPLTGIFTWAYHRTNKCPAGGIAGWSDKDGYVHIRVDGRLYLAHRLAWFHVHGEWPAGLIDHENRTPGDDWIKNLRPATHSQNHANTGMRADNKSGFKGVCWDRGKWRASIRHKGKCHFLGMFNDPNDAAKAYDAAAQSLFGDFSLTNEAA